MDSLEMLLNKLTVINFTDPISRNDLLTTLTENAIEAGWAKPGFTQAVLEREEKYPTGLHTHGVEVAIPHASPEWTLVPSMVVAILDHTVEFQAMGGGENVNAGFVFLLIIPDSNTHLTFLQALAEFIEDEEKLRLMGKTKDIQLLIDHFKIYTS